jgi:oligopeptide transport system substrate-binding protein
MRKLKVMALFLVVVTLLLSGCFNNSGTSEPTGTKDKPGGNNEVTEKIIRTNSGSEPGSLHPGKAEGSHDSWILDHTFVGLIKKTAEGKIVPGMADTWEQSDDSLTWTFHLKEGLKWSNGDPLTATDFEYAWKHVLNPETASVYAYQLYYLEGGQEYNAAEEGADLKALEDKVGVKAINDTTLEVKLAQPTPYFLEVTSHFTYYPINKKVQEENPDWYKEAATFVSNGAFKLTQWNHKENIKLEKNENYFAKDEIKLDGLFFTLIEDENTAWQMYQSGELDLVYPLPQDVTGKLMAEKDPIFHNGPDLSLYYLNINTKEKPFNNVKIRKALSLAIDRQTIVEHVAQGGQKPAYGIVPPGILDTKGDFQENSGDLFKEDVEEAKKLLAEGLAEEGLDKLPPFVYTYNTLEAHKKIAEAVQEMWRKNLGIEITLENVEFQVKLDREKAGDFAVSRGGWIGDYVDPMTFLDLWITDGPENNSQWSNKEYDRLIAEAKSTMDTAKRMKAMHEAEKIAIEEFPVIPIYFYTKPYVVRETVTGVYAPINRYPQMELADIQ